MTLLISPAFTLLFNFIILVSCSNASAPALVTTPASYKTSTTAPPAVTETLQCDSGRKEDAIICDANARNKDAVHQVIDEDDTAIISPQVPPSEETQDVWVKAYNQWVTGQKKSDLSSSKSDPAQRAIDAARQRRKSGEESSPSPPNTSAKNTASDAKDHIGGSDGGDDELKLITRAAKALIAHNSESVLDSHLISTLELVNELCVSGDNGRQFSSTGGLDSILHLLHHRTADNSVTVSALRALATCAQNNSPVFKTAVDAGAISVTAHIGCLSNERSRAAALRVLLALADSPQAPNLFWTARDDITSIIVTSIDTFLNEAHSSLKSNVDCRRCQLRSFSLINLCIAANKHQWVPKLREAGILEMATAALKSDDVDVREGAAQTVQFLRE